ncbi:MAG: hypothetical protein AB7D29_07770 [Campylobacterales bacterium]
MAYQNGTANGYLDLLDKIKTLALANGWSVKRDTSTMFDKIYPDLNGVDTTGSSTSYGAWSPVFDGDYSSGGYITHIELLLAVPQKPIGYKYMTNSYSTATTFTVSGIDEAGNTDILAASNTRAELIPISTTKNYKKIIIEKAGAWEAANEVNVFFESTTVLCRELILHSTGLNGDSNIIIGFRTVMRPGGIRNIEMITATGYTDAASFYSQPGVTPTPIMLYAHDGDISYWLNINADRIACVTKIYEPTDDYERNEVYQFAHLGFLKAYGLPSQFPAPFAISGGGLTKTARWSSVSTDLPQAPIVRLPSLRYAKSISTATSFSDSMPYTHDTDGNILSMPITIFVSYANNTDPYSNTSITERALIGEYDGIIKILATNGAKSEDTLTIDGDDYIVFQNGKLKTVSNYFAMRMS